MIDQTKVIGLDLLRNPRNTRRVGTPKSNKIKQKIEEEINPDSIEVKFKKHMKQLIDNFKLPLESYEKNDPIKINLESCWYFYSKNSS